MSNLSDKIFAVQDLDREEVKIPEWSNGEPLTLYVRTMTGGERDEFEHCILQKSRGGAITDARGIKSKLVVATLVDADGVSVFEGSDIERLESKSAAVIDRLVGVAQRLNGLTDKDVDELKNG